jgi:hypothetical protein
MTHAGDTANELVRAAVGGNRAALNQIVDLLKNDVYRLAMRMLGHPEDAAQEALVQVVTNLASFRDDGHAPGRSGPLQSEWASRRAPRDQHHVRAWRPDRFRPRACGHGRVARADRRHPGARLIPRRR